MHAILFALLAIGGVGSPQVDPLGGASPFVGTWLLNLSKSKLPPNYQYRSITLQFAVVFDSVTIGARFVTTSGQEHSATELFHMDGSEHPGTLNPGVVITGKWINSHVIETTGKKDGQDAGVITYEVLSDGQTLTQKYSGSPEQVLVFERK